MKLILAFLVMSSTILHANCKGYEGCSYAIGILEAKDSTHYPQAVESLLCEIERQKAWDIKDKNPAPFANLYLAMLYRRMDQRELAKHYIEVMLDMGDSFYSKNPGVLMNGLFLAGETHDRIFLDKVMKNIPDENYQRENYVIADIRGLNYGIDYVTKKFDK